ncbi:DUF4432 family protein [Sulfitobacter sp. D35]|uniref:DUF4432 family protein n=1 Tax=Sulfitobacter sp. D35 TaxID=3083252 RepID=UPI00296F7BC2|nr:DUF4432 family protein [Sulfitobacter sp. D35]MDW4497200.1 DUF4432 family protein [Sulfitobacter sp. D35]
MTATLARPVDPHLAELTGDRRQLAAVRRITLDEGPSRGQRALAFSTGGGLDFWVLADRTMDIGPLWVHGMPIAWQHPGGMLAPQLHDAASDGGTGIERALSGFLLTCGLDNVRQPRDSLPLHGTLPLTPARITAHGEDWSAPEPVIYAEGEAVRAHLRGASFSLRRRIEAPVGKAVLRLTDTIENIGPDPSAFRILYHTNFGYPSVGPGTRLSLNGRETLRHEPAGAREAAPRPAACHDAGPGRFQAVFDRPAFGPWPALSISVEGDAAALPFVQVWSDPRPRRNIVSVEPANCGRRDDGTSEPGMTLAPGARWTSTLTYRFATPSAATKGDPHGNG